jgi:hypothetical protein
MTQRPSFVYPNCPSLPPRATEARLHPNGTPAGFGIGVDITDPKLDNAFGQGAKENDTTVSVVTGSIPPQKSDLTRFYVSNETRAVTGDPNPHTFIYLAWERSNILGSANIDFELNQLAPTLSADGKTLTLHRTADDPTTPGNEGDLLITFDFTKGGGLPVLGARTWQLVPGTTSTFAWLNPVDHTDTSLDLSALGFAVGSVNDTSASNFQPDPGQPAGTTTVVDPITGQSLTNLTFGEAAIDLTASGIFPPGVCENFGSAFVKSRSSTSFTAELKDFIAPIAVNVENCVDVTNTAEVTAAAQLDFDSTPNNHVATEDDQASVTVTIGSTSGHALMAASVGSGSETTSLTDAALQPLLAQALGL